MLCACGDRLRSEKSFFFLNERFDFKRCHKTERLVGLNKFIALSQKLTRQMLEFGHEKHLKMKPHAAAATHSILLTDALCAHNRKMRTISLVHSVSPSALMTVTVHHKHKLKKLVIWFLIFHIFEVIEIDMVPDAIVVIVNRRFVLIGRLFEIDLVTYILLPHCLLSVGCDQIDATYTNKFKNTKIVGNRWSVISLNLVLKRWKLLWHHAA